MPNNFASTHGTPFFNGTRAVTVASATAAAVVGQINYITDLSAASGVANATVKIQELASSKVLWELPLVASTPVVVSFNSPIWYSANNTLIATIANGGGNVFVNIGGFTL
jgi:hypothetical protein